MHFVHFFVTVVNVVILSEIRNFLLNLCPLIAQIYSAQAIDYI